MTTVGFHPGVMQLLRLQSRGRGRRMWNRFRQPRRFVLSTVACLLAVVWLGNAAMTIWLREAASPDTLRALLSLGFVLYAGWHFAKAAFFPPETAFDWSTAEREALASMPLRPRDLVVYQLGSVTMTTVLKASLFTLLLFPDLRCVPLGLIGLFLAMLLLELVRMAINIVVWGMTRRTFLAYRAIVVVALAAVGIAGGSVIVREAAFGPRINFGEGFLQRLLDILLHLHESVFGYFALPFRPLVELIVASRATAANVGLAACAAAIVFAMSVGMIGLYTRTAHRVAERLRREYQAIEPHRTMSTARRILDQSLSGRHIPAWGGAGALAWRQLIGARRCWGSLLTAMIAPTILACAPCLVIANPSMAFLATMGTLVFYTFLLLPTALYFDFRRDLDRFPMLKSLPVRPFAVAVGQTITPVLIATVFQAVVLLLAIAARSLPLYHFFIAMLVLIPLNVLVFVVDNFIFLLYPYRLQQEGLEIFLRTMLTFTGKGLLFTLALAVLVIWVFAATALTRLLSYLIGVELDVAIIFTAGIVLGPSLLALSLLHALGRTFHRLDSAEDLPR